jgi:small subunit ribosomal protein S3
MGQKVNPHGLRVGVIKNWDSRWFAKDEVFGDTLVSDYNIRKYLKKALQDAGIPKIEIERDSHRVRVFVHCAKPGMVIGRGGEQIDKYKKELEAMVGMPVALNVVEVRQPDLNAQLVAENIASQLERRVSFRRAMKMAIRNTMRNGAKGIKVNCAGRLGGAEIARSEHYHEGTIPLQTIRADIDYGFAEANTTYGKIGVKVWIYKGEVLSEVARTQTGATAAAEDKKKFGDRRNGDRRDRRNGDRREGGRGFGGDRKGGGDRRDGNRNFGDRRNGSDRPMRNSDRPMRAPVAPAAPKETTEGGAN